MNEMICFPVAGMTCSACVNHITRAVGRLDGVSKVSVDLGRETVTVSREPDVASDASIARAIAAAGYDPDFSSAELLPPGTDRSLVDRLTHRLRGRSSANQPVRGRR